MAMIDLFSDGDPEFTWRTLQNDGDKEFEMKILGVPMSLEQDVGDERIEDLAELELGTTAAVVWDAAVNLVRFLERQALIEDDGSVCSPSSLKTKRALELGSGCCGLGGLAISLLGCTEVVLTDISSVLPMLRRNAERFITAAQNELKQGNPQIPHDCAAIRGDIHVMELDWFKEIEEESLKAPFDVIVMADVIYTDGLLLKPLLKTLQTLVTPSTKIILSYEWRSAKEHAAFQELFLPTFELTEISRNQFTGALMNEDTFMYVMRLR
ncbi:hypothetical protein CYMTET_52153 [Cymbomonas tetramitiformis]|uniref:Uncharacterized protein n=1 Tax=Cymbomonas tetramitiformis TaxID=36881 RepID=A0AAE0BKR5_9CHLO|nr:hypothetical protein CYMTET_52153 [Cymbomonas tetramitiformis]|eukprot:gene23124-27977_t